MPLFPTLFRSFSFHAGRNLLSPMTVVFRRFLRMSAGERPSPPSTTTTTTTRRHDNNDVNDGQQHFFAYIVIHTGAPSPFPLHHYPLFLLFLAICRSRDIDRYVAILSPCHVCLYYLKDRKRLRGVKLLMFVLRGRCLGSEERSRIPVHGV